MENNQLIKQDGGLIQRVGNAINVTNKLLALNAEAYFERGLEKANLGKYKEAISDFSQAVELNPNFDLALARKYTLMGMLHDNEKNFDEAKVCFLKTIDLADEFYAYYKLVILFIEELKFDTAIYYIDIAISKFPENAQLHLIRGELKSDFLKIYSEAIDDFTKAIEIEKKTEGVTDILKQAYLGRAKARAKFGDDEGSKRDYLILKVRDMATRVRNEGLNEAEKKIFGIE